MAKTMLQRVMQLACGERGGMAAAGQEWDWAEAWLLEGVGRDPERALHTPPLQRGTADIRRCPPLHVQAGSAATGHACTGTSLIATVAWACIPACPRGLTPMYASALTPGLGHLLHTFMRVLPQPSRQLAHRFPMYPCRSREGGTGGSVGGGGCCYRTGSSCA